MKTTSIQISTKHRDMLKKHCEKFGFNMSSFVEKLIEEKATPQPRVNIYFDGTGRTVESNTPFGLYDKEEEFQKDCTTSMIWCARKLGYPVVEIELSDLQFYAAFEEAVNIYNSLKRRNYDYVSIDGSGKNWIKEYFFSLCKETLGAIRQKYQTIPIPGGEVQLDGSELKMEARIEREILIQRLPCC
jgi:hypothetical protein